MLSSSAKPHLPLGKKLVDILSYIGHYQKQNKTKNTSYRESLAFLQFLSHVLKEKTNLCVLVFNTQDSLESKNVTAFHL